MTADVIATKDIDAALDALKAGDVIGLPTETVYGLAGDAASAQAVARIFAVKGRPAINPLIAHVASSEVAWRHGRRSPVAEKLADAFWPGPLTLVLAYTGDGVCDAARAGLDTLAVRVPSHPVARAVLERFAAALAAPSANPSGRLSPTTAADVREAFGAAVPVVLDAGPTRVGLESTIVDCTGTRARLLRPGGVALEDIEAVLGHIDIAGDDGAILAPGALASHYAPRARVRLDAEGAEAGEAFLAFGRDDTARADLNLSATGDLEEAARNLFSALRRLDATGVASIAVMPIPQHGLGLAINDRLRRAAADREEVR